MTLKDYFETEKTDVWELSIYNFNIFIQNYQEEELCVEITDKKGNNVDIEEFVDITLDTKINDIKEIVLNYIIGNYLYNYF